MSEDLHRLGDQVDDAVEELLTLVPKLVGALERDQGAGEGERVASSTNVHVLPVNLDVLSAVKLLREETWPTTLRARQYLGESGQMMSLERTIESCGVLFRRLVGRQLNGEARRLADTVLRWQRIVRTAIGLSRRPEPLASDDGPIYCPLHDNPLFQLQHRGDEGTLDLLARGDREAITWRSGGGLYCPYADCEGEWGPGEFPFLGRLVAEQRLRITTTAASTSAH